MSIKAIETNYRGYRFRSRLEARWAVFFDNLKVRWTYEPEGFELSNGTRYLPDFFVDGPSVGYWIEVKPVAPTEAEKEKLRELCWKTGRMGMFLIGTPGDKRPLLYADSFEPLRNLGLVSLHLKDEVSVPEVRRAVKAARSARFEFGESGEA